MPDAPQCREADKDQENKNGRFQDSIYKGLFLSLKKQKKFFLHFPRRKKVCLSLYMAASWGGEGRPRFGWLTPTDPPPAAVVWHRELQRKWRRRRRTFALFLISSPGGCLSPPLLSKKPFRSFCSSKLFLCCVTPLLAPLGRGMRVQQRRFNERPPSFPFQISTTFSKRYFLRKGPFFYNKTDF